MCATNLSEQSLKSDQVSFMEAKTSVNIKGTMDKEAGKLGASDQSLKHEHLALMVWRWVQCGRL